jgi:GNAT superfamily N-acetyltransferase
MPAGLVPNILTFNVSNEMTEKALKFISRHDGGRITQKTLDTYRSMPQNMVMLTVQSKEEMIYAISACILDDGAIRKAITVVHKDYRNIGLGTSILKEKIEVLRNLGYVYETVIAEDNIASMSLCKKCGLEEVEKVQAIRRSGPYIAVTMKGT